MSYRVKIRIVIALIFSTSCVDGFSQTKLVEILEGLEKNHILKGRLYASDLDQFMSDSIDYHNAIASFYSSPGSIIDEILRSFEHCDGLSGLIVPRASVLSSELDACELIDCKIGALMLIDNYLLNLDRSKIKCVRYFVGKDSDELLESFKVFYSEQRNSGLEKLRLAYKSEFLKKLVE